MTRRCSHCSNNGHNSRTCPTKGGGGGGGGGFKLFGVRLTDGSIKKSASMGNLSAHFYSSSPNPSSPDDHHPLRDSNPIAEGYVSDDPAHTSCSSNCRGERKKGVPWTEEEHKLFLMGLQKLGKGDWRGIARNFVVSRTPTQVASHAQKYFIRQSNTTRRKRRSSLFDMASDMHTDVPTTPTTPKVLEEQLFLPASEACESENLKSLPSLHLSLERDCDHMETTCNETPAVEAQETGEACENFAMPIPVFLPTYLPVAFPFWQLNLSSQNGEVKNCMETSNHQVLKPTPVLSKDRMNVDELLGMSKLTLGTGTGPSPPTLELLGAPSRQSAFHANHPPGNGSDLSSSKSNAIHAL